jgi:hypothetical protein
MIFMFASFLDRSVEAIASHLCVDREPAFSTPASAGLEKLWK